MFCMTRIVCHLKFEAIATQSTLRVSGSHTGEPKSQRHHKSCLITEVSSNIHLQQIMQTP